MRHPKTEWGLRVKMFTQLHGITIKELAAAAGVKESVIYSAMTGRNPGYEIIPKVNAYMALYERFKKR